MKGIIYQKLKNEGNVSIYQDLNFPEKQEYEW